MFLPQIGFHQLLCKGFMVEMFFTLTCAQLCLNIMQRMITSRNGENTWKHTCFVLTRYKFT